MPKFARQESGVQLLTRLRSRPDLSKLDPHIFGQQQPASSSASSYSRWIHSKTRKLSTVTTGHLVEIYGPEGAGKSELALHYVARTCLPCFWKDISLGGLGAHAVVVDTELKFSVLRLAVILEKEALALLQAEGRDEKSDLDHDIKSDTKLNKNEQILPDNDIRSKTKSLNLNSSFKNAKHMSDNHAQRESHQYLRSPLNDKKFQNKSQICGESYPNFSRIDTGTDVGIKCCMEMEKGDSDGREGRETMSSREGLDRLTPEEVENIVKESLGRVKVVKAHSVHELFISLLSLEQDLTCNSQTALLLLDSVSAFFWEGRLAESSIYMRKFKPAAKGGLAVAGGMAQVAAVVSRLVSELRMNIITTKSPLVGQASSSVAASASGRKRKWREDKDDGNAGRNNSGSCQQEVSTSFLNEDACEDEHVEFLGKAWSNLNPTRITLSLTEGTSSETEAGSDTRLMGRKVTTATCSSWPSARRFTFVNDALIFL
ncbi:DNA repair protein xrcc2-like [Plakobranchus ocellatus]|uniref:DNA repair protein xrcc2-like n=1 Tax=Plakobranchus ocellatus TaxID=259542 RepID=A0AAV3XPS2_9GAST|nr:DNA repair protein xrcc2-like [Plakobranchus ocellatus]